MPVSAILGRNPRPLSRRIATRNFGVGAALVLFVSGVYQFTYFKMKTVRGAAPRARSWLGGRGRCAGAFVLLGGGAGSRGGHRARGRSSP